MGVRYWENGIETDGNGNPLPGQERRIKNNGPCLSCYVFYALMIGWFIYELLKK